MGINVISNTQSQELTLAASTAITSGNLVTQTEGGLTFPTTSQLTLASQNIATAGPSALYAYNTIGANYRTFSDDWDTVVQLGNGVLAFANSGDGTTANTGVNVFYYTQSGGAFRAKTTVVSTINIGSVKIKKLDSSKFVVVWTASGATLNFAIYNNDGTVAVAATTVTSAISASGSTLYNFNVLADGDIVFAYRKITSNDFAFVRYNSSGVLQGSETVVEAGSTPSRISVLAHSSGDFWLYYYRNAATTAYKFARYNSSGVLQGTLTTVVTNSGNLNMNWVAMITELGNGNVLIFSPNGSNFPDANLYNSSGTLVTSNTTYHGSSNTIALAAVCPFVLVEAQQATIFSMTDGNVLSVWKIDNSLNFIGPRIQTGAIGNFTTSTTTGYLKVFSEGSAGYSILTVGYTSTWTATISCVNTAGTVVGTNIVPYSGISINNGNCAIKTAEGNIVFNVNRDNSDDRFGVYSPGRKNIIGVAQQTVSAGSTFRCATVGTYTINNAPSTPGLFDNRTATPGGARGNVSGTTAILNGLV